MAKVLTAVALVATIAAVTAPPASARLDRVPGGRVAYVQQSRAVREHRRMVERRQARREAEREAAAAAAATTEPSATPAPSYNSSAPAGPLYVSQATVAAAMRAAGFPESEVQWFVYTIQPADGKTVIERESNYCPTAVNPGHCGDVSYFIPGGPACSLFQLYTCPGPQVADPYVAARYAYAKWQSQGRGAWGG
jgi:hypothetical protein